jgi:3-methyladenine DNA glycosylase AlkD
MIHLFDGVRPRPKKPNAGGVMASGEGDALIATIATRLRDSADPVKAPQMQAYMKSAMPYLGVQTQPRRAVCREAFREHPLSSFEEWRQTVRRLWRDASYREERYAAIELASYHGYRNFRSMKAMPMLEEMITTGAWWDYVDGLATGPVAEILRRSPRGMSRRMRAWAKSNDIWKRRTAIICQLGFKRDTDLDLFYDCIEPSMQEREFFLRKAIGWALREYAKTDPHEVIRYVTKNRERLSPLSRREALRNVVKAGLLEAIP